MVPSWSADGESVAYGEFPFRGTTPNGIHIWNFKSHSGSILPASEGYYWPSWSQDGKWLAAFAPNPTRFVLYSPTTKKWQEWAKQEHFVDSWAWSSDSNFIYVLVTNSSGTGIYRIPISTGKWELFASLTGVRVINRESLFVSVTPDNMPAVMSNTSVTQIYQLEWNK